MPPPLRRLADDGVRAGQAVDQAEVGHLDVVADQEQVVRLDVEVLQAVLEVDDVQGLGRLAEEAEQLLARDAGLALPLIVEQDRLEVAVGQLHDEDQHAVEDLDAFEGEEEGVADALDALDGFPFLGGEAAAGVGVAADELDGLEEAAGGLALPDLAEAAAAQRLDEPVAGQRLGARLPDQTARRRCGGDSLSRGATAKVLSLRSWNATNSRGRRGGVGWPAGARQNRRLTAVLFFLTTPLPHSSLQFPRRRGESHDRPVAKKA